MIETIKLIAAPKRYPNIHKHMQVFMREYGMFYQSFVGMAPACSRTMPEHALCTLQLQPLGQVGLQPSSAQVCFV